MNDGIDIGLQPRLRAGARALRGVAGFAIATLLCATAYAGDADDVVILANGGHLRGLVMEQSPTTGVRIRLLDGRVRQVSPGDLASVQIGAQPSPPAPASPAPATAPAPAPPAPVPTPQAEPEPQDDPEYVEGKPPPRGYHVERGMRRWAFFTGLGAFVVGYALGIAAASNHDETGTGAVPLVGAFVVVAKGSPDRNGFGANDTAQLVAAGAFQVIGVAGAILGVALQQTKLVRDDGALHVNVTPLFVARGAGMGLAGSF